MKQSNAGECALLSEDSLAEDWNRSEEDEAWQNFQQEYCACPIDMDQL